MRFGIMVGKLLLDAHAEKVQHADSEQSMHSAHASRLQGCKELAQTAPACIFVQVLQHGQCQAVSFRERMGSSQAMTMQHV